MCSGSPALCITLLAFPYEDRGGNRETYLSVPCPVPFLFSVSIPPSLSPSPSLCVFFFRKKSESSDEKEDDKEQESEKERGKTTYPSYNPSCSLSLSLPLFLRGKRETCHQKEKKDENGHANEGERWKPILILVSFSFSVPFSSFSEGRAMLRRRTRRMM